MCLLYWISIAQFTVNKLRKIRYKNHLKVITEKYFMIQHLFIKKKLALTNDEYFS